MYNLSHLDDEALMRGFASLLACDRSTTARLLAHIAEIDARHLYLRAGFESMQAYCVRHLHLSTDAASKRLQVARLARELPVLFEAIADGRLHLKAVRLLAPRLNRANVDELIEAAAGRTAGEVEIVLANRFPQAEPLRFDDGISPQVVVPQLQNPKQHAPGHAVFEATVAPRVQTRIAPLSAERYTLQVTLPGPTHDKFRHLQRLLGHAVPNGDVAEVLDRAFDALIRLLEKRKFGSRPAGKSRAIRGQVRWAVNKRDGGRCVQTLPDGSRCGSIERVEFDHIVPLAKGGTTTIDNLRLLCRAHNQAAAESEFGLEHVEQKKAERRSRGATPPSRP